MENRFIQQLVLFTCLANLGVNAAMAQSWEEQQIRNQERQRQALAAQAQQGLTPDAVQHLRWEAEWRAQHPGEPMPSAGRLQQMHTGEIIANSNRGWTQGRQNRQNELQRNMQWARQAQEQRNAAQHITWSPQQWAVWYRNYDLEQQRRAREYEEGVREAGQIQSDEMHRRVMNGQTPW